MDPSDVLKSMITPEGRKRALWVLINSGIVESGDEEPLKPIKVDDDLSDDEIDLFDRLEVMIQYDYEKAYGECIKIVRILMNARRFKSAIYVCDMIGDEILRREVLKNGLIYYESVGDFGKALEFARQIGDVKRMNVYRYLHDLLNESHLNSNVW